MNRKEQILDASLTRSPSTDIRYWILGALWADENPISTQAKLIEKYTELTEKFYKIAHYSTLPKEIYQLMNDIAYLKKGEE